MIRMILYVVDKVSGTFFFHSYEALSHFSHVLKCEHIYLLSGYQFSVTVITALKWHEIVSLPPQYELIFCVSVIIIWFSLVESIQNATIEERVTILEIQVDQIQGDVTGLSVGLTEVDDNVDFLFDEQVIQDERLLGLENRMLDVENRVLDTENEVNGDHFNLKIFWETIMYNIFYDEICFTVNMIYS